MLLLLLNELINSIIINFIHKQRSYHKHNSNLHTRHIKITALRQFFCPLIYNVHIFTYNNEFLVMISEYDYTSIQTLKCRPHPHSPIFFVSSLSTACCTQRTPARACRSVTHKSRGADTVPTMSQDFRAD